MKRQSNAFPEDEELLDLVDVNDIVVGQVARSAYYKMANKPGFVRSANLFLVNSGGQLWIPRRSATQKIKPNGLDYSAGGHVSTGETYEQAIIREAQEELGIAVDPAKLIYIGKLGPEPPREYYFCGSFVYLYDKDPGYSPDEFSGFEWLYPNELLQLLDRGENAKESLRGVVQLWLDYQADTKRN